LEDPKVKDLNVVRIKHLGRRISFRNDIRAYHELKQVITELRPVIVHSHTFKAGLISRLIPGAHKRVHTFHGHLFDDASFSRGSKILVLLIERFLANRTNTLVSVGSQVGLELQKKGIGKNQNWLSIPPGIEPLTHVNKFEAREKLGLRRSGIIFGWMARMAPVKNPLLLLEIAGKLPEIEFVMAGGGELLEEVRSKAPKNVFVIGWADAALFWSSVDCAISTSDNEGIPIALIEAQYAGLPIVATDVGSTSEVVENNISGYLATKSTSEFIQVIRRLNENDDLRQRIGRNAKTGAEIKFSLAKMIDAHKELYFKII
jgi:glycosyltransferase involved in cell wall biosynthesis